MSFKNTSEIKKLRRLERSLRKGRLPRFFSLIEWLEDRGYADTKGAAVKLILEDRVLSESHPLGKTIKHTPGPTKQYPDRVEKKEEVFQFFYPVDLLGTIKVKE